MRLTLVEIEVAFRRPLVTAIGTFTSRRSVLVGIETAGAVGWGEAPAFPSGRFGTADEAFAELAQPTRWTDGRPTVPIARAALEAATADMHARAAGRTLHDWLGASGTPVPARHPIGLLDPAVAEQEAIWLEAHGIKAVKVKIAPGHDLEPIRTLRAALPGLDIGIDANAGYRDPADPVFSGLADLGVSFIEQPLAAGDLESHRVLRERLETPVCLDESISSIADVEAVIATEAADQVSIKLNRYGLTDLKHVLDLARDHGVGVRVGGTFDTSIGRRHLLAASGLPGVVDAAVGPPAGYLAGDVADYPAVVDGLVAPTEADGLGTAPDVERLAQLEVRRATVEF